MDELSAEHHELLFDTTTFEAPHWLPSCECGWTGQEHDTREAASDEWATHHP